MQRIDCYCFCKTCDKIHLLTDGDCFPRFRIYNDDTGPEGYEIAARSLAEAAELYVNGCDEDYELIGKSVVVEVGDSEGNRKKFEVTGHVEVHYEAETI